MYIRLLYVPAGIAFDMLIMRGYDTPGMILNVECQCPTSFPQIRVADGRELHSRAGVSRIRFDRQGVLFAAAGSNGLIRVFDFDECLAALRKVDSRYLIS
jgi:hypothetical protein